MFHPRAKKNSKDAGEGMRRDLKITCRINLVNFFVLPLQDTFFLPSISNMDISSSHVFFPHPPFSFLSVHINFAFFLNFLQSSLSYSPAFTIFTQVFFTSSCYLILIAINQNQPAPVEREKPGSVFHLSLQ